MEISYLDAQTFGIGQLISQRKLFRVPEHQRDFSWEQYNVEQFFEDITTAMVDGDPDYFIGLIVLLGSDNAWQILDGQQRLATVTMIYSAIRHWLAYREDYMKDADQIDSNFIGVRQLGGSHSPRLRLNVANRDTFVDVVVKRCPDEELSMRLSAAPKRSSNYLLIEAAKTCRELVNAFASQDMADPNKQALRLFGLAEYLEYRVKAAVLDVLSEENAFVIFEALNARGNELSVLDLVKNHIFGNAGPEHLDAVRPKWTAMAERIEDRSADDFLKVFWTSRFGRVQKPQLYDRIKKEFAGQQGSLDLATELTGASEHYLALDDPRHELWSRYGPTCAENIETLALLGNRQVRAPIMSAIDVLHVDEMESLLGQLIVLTVRYQVVGRRRTGALEIACARLASLIRQGHVKTAGQQWESIRTIMPTDEEFFADFLRFSERKASRVAYFLAELEATFQTQEGMEAAGLDIVAHHPSDLIVDFVLPKIPAGGWQTVVCTDPLLVEERLFWLGNRCLLESTLDDRSIKPESYDKACPYYVASKFLLTNRLCSTYPEWGRREIEQRQGFLANLAVETWPLPTLIP